MRLRIKLGAMAAAIAAATFLVAGPAMAGTTGHVRSVSGNEYISGAVYGQAVLAQTTTLPLKFRGLVRTYSNFTLPNNNGNTATIPTPQGNLHLMVVGAMVSTMKFLPGCYGIADTNFAIKVTGGTGVFRGAFGPGHVQLVFKAYLPRYKGRPHKGQCNPNGNPTTPKGAEAALYAQVTPLTIHVH